MAKAQAIAISAIIFLLAFQSAAPTFANPSSKGTTQKISMYGTSAPLSLSSGTTSFQVDQDIASELPPPSTYQVNKLIPFSGLQPVRTSADQIPSTPGSALASTNPGLSGFNGLNHRDQRLAGTGVFANTQFSLEPPDQALCVSSSYVLEAVNTALVVYDTAGNKLTAPTPLNQFFQLAPEVIRGANPVFGDFATDPKCYFDGATSRWFISLVTISQDPNTGAFLPSAHQLLAVSKTSNPTGKWFLYSIDVTNDGTDGTPSHPNCPCFGDQPLIGADAKGFYVSTNEFPLFVNGFNGAQIYAMSKSGLESGTITNLQQISAGSYTIPNDAGPTYSLQPATVPPGGSFAPSTEYFLGTLQLNSATDNRIALWALTGTDSLATSSPSVSLSMAVVQTELYGGTPAGTTNALQKDGPTPLGSSFQPAEKLEFISTNDDRMNQVVFAGGNLFAGINTVIKTQNGPAVNGIAYFIITPSISGGTLSGSIANQGYVAVNNEYVMFPSIGVNSAGKGIMAFTLSGSDFFPTAAYVTIDAVNGAGPVHIFAMGAAPEDGFTGYYNFGFPSGISRTARWGDYSAAVAAPDGSIWFANEYISGGPRTLFANWATFVGNVVLP